VGEEAAEGGGRGDVSVPVVFKTLESLVSTLMAHDTNYKNILWYTNTCSIIAFHNFVITAC
jgi:hypothetical protein